MMEKPNIETCTDKEYSKWIWSDYHEQCKKCKQSCKQSHIIKQVSCSKFNRIEEINAGI